MQQKNRPYWLGTFLCIFAIVATGYVMKTNTKKHHSENHDLNVSHDVSTQSRGNSVTVADGDTVVVTSQGSDLSYDITEIRANAGETITIRYENPSDMPHNVVLVKSEADINPVGIAALQAYEDDYIPEAEMDRILGYTTLAVPGDTVYMTITVPPAGSYPYVCTYPGHFTAMQGRLISRE